MEIKIKSADGTMVDTTLETKDGVMIVSPVVEEAPKPKRWRDDKDALFNGFWIDGDSSKICYVEDAKNETYDYDVFVTEKQAKSALAMARISQIMANDDRFGGIVTDEEWNNAGMSKYIICRASNFITSIISGRYHFLAFHTEEQRDLFLEENEDLVKVYLML